MYAAFLLAATIAIIPVTASAHGIPGAPNDRHRHQNKDDGKTYTKNNAGCRKQWERSWAPVGLSNIACKLKDIKHKKGKRDWCRITAYCPLETIWNGTGHERKPKDWAYTKVSKDRHERNYTHFVRVYRSVRIEKVDNLRWCPKKHPGKALVYSKRC